MTTTYKALARRYRPQCFRDVLGQNAVVSTLQNAFKLGRLSHAYLLSGPRGTGKTTIASLLRRFWDVSSGEILIGGQNIRRFSQQALSEIIGYVPQQAHLFNGTIRDNLLLGKPDATDEDIREACRKAQIEDLLKLPDGLNAWIGEQGILLSGGERQRLALARLLIKETPVLIFDEPMARLDSASARNIFETINHIQSPRTIIVISHLPIAAAGWTLLNLSPA